MDIVLVYNKKINISNSRPTIHYLVIRDLITMQLASGVELSSRNMVLLKLFRAKVAPGKVLNYVCLLNVRIYASAVCMFAKRNHVTTATSAQSLNRHT